MQDGQPSVPRHITRDEGRRVFGDVAETYDRYRPPYPAGVWERLTAVGAIHPGSAVFEIGPGTGQATRELLRRGADPLLAIEPDPRLAAVLADRLAGDRMADRVTIDVRPFEDVALKPAGYDLGVAATSFHWLDQASALLRVAAALKRGGWWAMWWTEFGDPLGDDPFNDATGHLFADGPTSPSHAAPGDLPFALRVDERRHDLAATGAFDKISHEVMRVIVPMTTGQVVGLSRTFSPVAMRPEPERERLLASLARITDEQFGGLVRRPMLTTLYLARRRG